MRLTPISTSNVDAAEAMARRIFPNEVHDGVFWPRAGYDEAIEKGWPRFRYYIADIEGAAVGITGHYPLDEEQDELWIGWFGILPEYRRQGLGTALFELTKEMVAGLDQSHVKLYAGIDDVAAQILYLKAGLRVVDVGDVDKRPVVFFSSERC